MIAICILVALWMFVLAYAMHTKGEISAQLKAFGLAFSFSAKEKKAERQAVDRYT